MIIIYGWMARVANPPAHETNINLNFLFHHQLAAQMRLLPLLKYTKIYKICHIIIWKMHTHNNRKIGIQFAHTHTLILIHKMTHIWRATA